MVVQHVLPVLRAVQRTFRWAVPRSSRVCLFPTCCPCYWCSRPIASYRTHTEIVCHHRDVQTFEGVSTRQVWGNQPTQPSCSFRVHWSFAFEMPVICIGPVCVPLNLFLPFLLGVLHSYGFFKFIKKEWVDYRWYWRHMKRYMGWEEKPKAAAVQTETSSKAAQESTGKTQAMTPEDDNSLTQRRKQSEAVEQR